MTNGDEKDYFKDCNSLEELFAKAKPLEDALDKDYLERVERARLCEFNDPECRGTFNCQKCFEKKSKEKE